MTEKKSQQEELTAMLAKKDAARRKKGGSAKATESEGLPVTDEELESGLRFVDMERYNKNLKK